MLWNEFPSNSGTETLFSLISCSSNFEYFVVTSAMKDGAIRCQGVVFFKQYLVCFIHHIILQPSGCRKIMFEVTWP